MPRFDKEFIRLKIEKVLDNAGQRNVPVNLVPIAKLQNVLTIELRPMIIEGCIEPVVDGFKIYVQNRTFQSLRVDDDLDLDRLKPRQRFTLAHEIAHTFFYDCKISPPKLLKDAPKERIIESLCQRGAGLLLVPTRFLRQNLEKNQPLASQLLIDLGRKFATSPEVVIRRIYDLDYARFPYRALVLARMNKLGEDAEIIGIHYHDSLLPFFKKPKLHSTLREWSNLFKEEEFWAEIIWDHKVERDSGSVLIRKRPYREHSFFLELEAIPKLTLKP